MPRAMVCVGRVEHVEVQEFTYKDGERKGEVSQSLNFTLGDPATAVSGSVQFEAKRPEVMEQVKAAARSGERVEVVAIPRAIAYKDKKDGSDKTFVKMVALSVL